MKINLISIYILIIGVLFSACNDEVFVPRPAAPADEEQPQPDPDPDPDPKPQPESKDSLFLKSYSYITESLEVGDQNVVDKTSITFENNTDYRGASVFYDNYNKITVRISNNTQYVTPWAKTGQPEIEIPGFDSNGVAIFNSGISTPFKFGAFQLNGIFKAGEKNYFDLPEHSKVTATITITKKAVKAKANMQYYSTQFPEQMSDGWFVVQVIQPVDITVEWSDVTPL